MEEIRQREFTRPSLNGEGELFSRAWIPERPRAVVQIAHGMCEHSGRYQRVGTMLAGAGYAVYMNDHCGHGRSAMGHPGTFSLHGHGFDFVLGDMKTLFDLAREEHPGLPKILIGHSMGSILAGIYADRWGRGLRGLALLGTPSPSRAAASGARLAGAISRRKGQTYESPFLQRIAGGATNGCPGAPAMERKQWLTHDQEVIRAYVEDPLCGFEFSASAMAELVAGLAEFGSENWGAGVPKGLPVLIMAGQEDRGGGFGKAPRYYARQLRAHGVRNVTMKILPHARHEVLNETNHVPADRALLEWLETCL